MELHRAGPLYWSAYEALPSPLRELADRSCELLKLNPKHPSPHSSKLGIIGLCAWVPSTERWRSKLKMA